MNTLTAFYDLPKEWEVVRLLDITHIFDGTHQTPQYTHHGVAFFSVENIANNKPNKFISQQDYLIATSKNKPEYNDILLTRIGAIGISKVVSWTYPFSIYVTLAVIKQSKYFNSYYLHYFIQSSFFQKELKDNSLLQAIPCKINMDKLKKCKVILPPLNEQSAIANILSALDRYLYALDALILKKEGVKKALSFELLSQRKRLKGFNQAWQRVRLGDIANYLTSNLSVEQITQQGKIKVYDVNNFIGYTDTTFISDKPYISIVKDGSVGRVRILPPKTNILSTMGALIANHRTTTEFLFYLLSNFDFKNFTSGSIIPHIYFKDYKEKTIFLPPLNEQSTIANILSALDNEIASLKNKKRQFENIKKALNHDLMSAKIRVLKK
ncbi:restriction endonuclease subunit S [Helicobacter pylori]|uniref:restriction endonuclease subunit S n=1 Tax=Helicobacter pylori TaxID=210 RepID=UPI001920E098|nr:restriction endonuclease subunit S [Helicobacter pylori]QQW62406.1 restriction endonuclease subunit S [Helicobacter pylori]